MKTSYSQSTGSALPYSILSQKSNTPLSPEREGQNKKLKVITNLISLTAMKNLIGKPTAVKAFLFSMFIIGAHLANGQDASNAVLNDNNAINISNETSVTWSFDALASGLFHITFNDEDIATNTVTVDVNALSISSQSGTVDLSSLSDGTITMVVTGDVVGTSSSDTETMDTVAPSVAIDLDAGSDSGDSDSDDYTNDTTPTFNITGDASDNVQIDRTGLANVASAMPFDGNEPLTITPAIGVDGVYAFTVTSTDAAGNTGVAGMTVTIDTSDPTFAGDGTDVILNGFNGAGGLDNPGPFRITPANETSINVVVDGNSGETGYPYLLDYTISNGSSVAGTSTVGTSGNKTLTGIDVSSLPDGELTLSITLTDIAGNNSSVAQDTETKDTTSPVGSTIPNVTELVNAPDKLVDLAAYFEDAIDADEDLTFSLVTGESYDVFSASITANTLTIDFDATGTTMANTVTVQAQDIAGNTSTQTFFVTVSGAEVEFDITIDSETVAEESGTTRTFTITRNTISGDVYQVSSLTYTLTGEAANLMDIQNIVNSGGTDGLLTGVITFGAEDTSHTITFEATNDNLVEGNELLTMTLSDAAIVGGGTATIGDAVNTKTIDDQDQAVISVSDATADEDTGSLVFNVTMSTPVDELVKFENSTGEVTNEATDGGVDFNDLNFQVQFAAGQTTTTITVTIISDDVVEDDEDLNVISSIIRNSSNVLYNTISDMDVVFAEGAVETALGTIENDDVASISVDATKSFDESIAGANVAANSVTVVVTMVGEVEEDFQLQWQLNAGDAPTIPGDPGSALATQDFVDTGIQSIRLGGVEGNSKTITVNFVNNNVVERDETFKINPFLIAGGSVPYKIDGADAVVFDSDPTDGATVTVSPNGTGIFSIITIENDDEAELNITSQIDNNETVTSGNFLITLSNPIDIDITVDYSFTDGLAINGTDYNGTDGTLTWTALDNTNKSVPFTVVNDDVVERDEDFDFDIFNLDRDLSGANGGVEERTAVTIGTNDNRTYTILNEDKVEVRIFADSNTLSTSRTVTETNEDFTTEIRVQLFDQDENMANGNVETIDNDLVVTLDSETITSAIQAGTDMSFEDFTIPSSVTIVAGDSETIFTVTIKGDEVVERHEVFTTSINNVEVVFSMSTTAIAEYTADDEVMFDADVNAASITINNDDVTQLSITTMHQADASVEANTLTFIVNSSLAVDADYEVTFDVRTPAMAVLEGNGLVKDNDYTVQVLNRMTMNYETVSSDSYTLEFNDYVVNETKEIRIIPTNDVLVELDEDFEIILIDPATVDVMGMSTTVAKDGRMSALVANSDTGTGTIVNDDEAAITVADLMSVDEGDNGDDTQVTFTVTMDFPVDVDVNVPITFTDDIIASIVSIDDAIAFDDYIEPASLTVTFDKPAMNDVLAVGPLTRTFTVSIVEDIQVEEDEAMEITLGTPAGMGVPERSVAIGSASSASVTIDNDDSALFSIVTSEPLSINEEGIGKNTNSGDKDLKTTVDFTIELRDADNDMLTSADETVDVGVAFDLSAMTSTNFSDSGADFDPIDAFAVEGETVTASFDAGTGIYSMTVTFAANSQTVDISFTFNDDELVESNMGEDFTVSLTGIQHNIDPSKKPNPLAIDPAEDEITITVLETDFAIISMTQTLAGDPSGVYDEGDAGSQTVTYQVTIDKDIDRDISIDWTISDNTAKRDDANL
ncbi:MAG: Calx-beta domain-containing protein [Cyclobacteriaceae bacterium]